ncbi:anat-1, partial [Pristionchus pacificus]
SVLIMTMMRIESIREVEEVVDFLVDNFPQTETILSALRVKPSCELRQLLRDLIEDCSGSRSTSRVSRDSNDAIDGVILASPHSLLERQVDRLYSYSFTDERLRIANSFAQTVFNRVDIPFHVEEANMRSPLFIALICVRESQWGRGIGRTLLSAAICAGKEIGCDGAFGLASNEKANRLLGWALKASPQGVVYDSWKGEYKEPPIVPRDSRDRKMVFRIGHF